MFSSEITELSFLLLLQAHYFEEMINFEPRIIALAAVFVGLELLLLHKDKDKYPNSIKLSSFVIGSFTLSSFILANKDMFSSKKLS